MASCFIFNSATHQHHISVLFCKCPSSLNLPCFPCTLALSPPKHTTPRDFKTNRADNRLHAAKLPPTTDHETKRTADQVLENEKFMFARDRVTRKNVIPGRRRELGGGNSFKRCGDGNGRVNFQGIDERRGKRTRTRTRKGDAVDAENFMKLVKKSSSTAGKNETPEVQLRITLDMCSKRGDVIGAIQLYDLALKDGIKIRQYHYTVLLYLCSSAAVGVVQPAKSGSVGRSLSALDSTYEVATEMNEIGDKGNNDNDSNLIRVSEDVKEYALRRGLEIYQKMLEDRIQTNEATLTAVARMAMSMGDGDVAFDMVKQMKSLGINPKLRSYGPALMAFCANGEIDKACSVERHMLEHGVHLEEPELETLLQASVEAGKGDKVYYLLHKLRMTVRKVSASTASIITRWFTSRAASRFGKTRWDQRVIEEAMKNKGGGWHGQGWLGRGRWLISSTSIGHDAICQCCGEKLATIDLDPVETENFADSVASIAIKRDKDSSFQKFQKWLDYYGPFEAVIDGANVGLFSQKRFVPSKIKTIVNGIRQKLPSKRWPLIVLHNKRIRGPKMDQAMNKALVEKWKNADALYATPTGSNDDWYWLYAAIRFKCLIVTNDEMRDHKFQLLGNDFFPRWKERHQVHFSFSDAGPVFHMPPPYSVVIQESVKGHWHIPIAADHEHEESERSWLCIRRAKSSKQEQATPINSKVKMKPQEDYKNLREILSTSVFADDRSVLSEIEAAEKRGGCIIDFQI